MMMGQLKTKQILKSFAKLSLKKVGFLLLTLFIYFFFWVINQILLAGIIKVPCFLLYLIPFSNLTILFITAVPALIKLLHGNRNGKVFLSREFSDFWRKLQAGELDEEQLEGIPMLSSPVQGEFMLRFRV